MTEPVGLGEALAELLGRMGLAHPEQMDRIRDEWDEVVGTPWDQKSRPLYLRSRVLYIEVLERSDLALLRYGVESLRSCLVERYGTDVISKVELRTPARRR